jgi:hypothetical protein
MYVITICLLTGERLLMREIKTRNIVIVMYLPRRLKGIPENSRQSGSVVLLPVKTGSLPTRNSIILPRMSQLRYSSRNYVMTTKIFNFLVVCQVIVISFL